ncbi:MAG: PLP-dependent transferase, partial [Saprospiraceae bacterium]|nr:PLP-dependent transferase [Saprospiraceae bacterium]
MKGRNQFHPESHMMSFGYRPELSEGSVKCPVFPTSSFVFNSAEEGKAFFQLAYGKRPAELGETRGLIYSRINNPNLEIAEQRLRLWDGAEDGALFASGMAAIATVFWELLRPGDLLLYSQPVYGGTDHLIREILPEFGIRTIGIETGLTEPEVIRLAQRHTARHRLAMLYLETPSNPTNQLVDIAEDLAGIELKRSYKLDAPQGVRGRNSD